MIVTYTVTGIADVVPWVWLVVALTLILALTAYALEGLGWSYSGNGWKEAGVFGSGALAVVGCIAAFTLGMTWMDQNTELNYDAQRAMLVSHGYSELARDGYNEWIGTNLDGTLVQIDLRNMSDPDTYLLTEAPVDTAPDS